jgi:hypothetical protein
LGREISPFQFTIFTMQYSWAVCRCFFEKNIFIPELGHLVFKGRDQFESMYADVLLGVDKSRIIADIEAEIARRRNISEVTRRNFLEINEKYSPLHPTLFTETFKLPLPLSVQDVEEKIEGVFSFPLLSPAQCTTLVEEFNNFNQANLQHQKPTSMRTNGILLAELDLGPLLQGIVDSVQQIAKDKFPGLVGAAGFDSFKAFTVEYSALGTADKDQATHFDNAEVTLNIPLYTEEQEGNELLFQTQRGFRPLEMVVGQAILHAGSQQHCVLPITSGRRSNLIIWMRSSDIRRSECPMCKQIPDLEEVCYGKGDGFKTEKQVDLCTVV